MSDLHLELNQQYLDFDFSVTAPLLLLGGDVGRLVDYDSYLSFLARQTRRYEKVFLVLGNHEFHSMDYETGVQTAQTLEKEDVLQGKLVLLHRRGWNDETSTLTILGCTLWSHIPPSAEEVVRGRVSDFKHINEWSTARHNAAHVADLEWLTAAVEGAGPERTVLVATHHAPCVEGTSRPEQAANPWSCAFATDVLRGVMEESKVVVRCWVFGHTHHCADFEMEETRVVGNQRGYVLGVGKELLEKKRGFDAEKVLEL